MSVAILTERMITAQLALLVGQRAGRDDWGVVQTELSAQMRPNQAYHMNLLYDLRATWKGEPKELCFGEERLKDSIDDFTDSYLKPFAAALEPADRSLETALEDWWQEDFRPLLQKLLANRARA